MNTLRQPVITGLGVVSPIGIGKEAYWGSLREGRSGVGDITLFDTSILPVRFGAEIRGFDPKIYVRPRKSIKVMCREIQVGFAAAELAVEDAGLDVSTVDRDRFGVVFGSEMMYGELQELEALFRNCLVDHEFHFERFGERLESDLYPLWMLKYLPNMVACHIAIAQDARGPNNTIVQGEASSLLALIEAAAVIERGDADVMITGGTGTRLNVTSWMYRGDSNLSHRGDDPAAASRPFDAGRDGMVNGEGAAAYVVESQQHAAARGAALLARIAGHGRSVRVDPRSRSAGVAAIGNSISLALGRSGVRPADLSHVNAHGISDVEGDAIEATAIQRVLGDVAVTAPKSFFGNLGAGGGAVEMTASVLALTSGKVPMTLNYSDPDPRCPVNVVRDGPLPIDRHAALVLNQAGTGQTAAVVLIRDS